MQVIIHSSTLKQSWLPNLKILYSEVVTRLIRNYFLNVAAMVEDFEKKYGALAIPYPKDSAVADIAAEEAKQVAAYNKHVAESQARATTVSAELAKVKEIGYTFFGYISILNC